MTEVYLCSECASGLEANQPVMKQRDSVCGWCGDVGVLLLYEAEREVSETITPQEELDNNIDKAKEAHEFIEAVVEAETVKTAEMPPELVNVEEEVRVGVDPANPEVVIKVKMDASGAIEVLEELEEKAENITKTIDEQIAELQAKKAELEK